MCIRGDLSPGCQPSRNSWGPVEEPGPTTQYRPRMGGTISSVVVQAWPDSRSRQNVVLGGGLPSPPPPVPPSLPGFLRPRLNTPGQGEVGPAQSRKELGCAPGSPGCRDALSWGGGGGCYRLQRRAPNPPRWGGGGAANSFDPALALDPPLLVLCCCCFMVLDSQYAVRDN